MPQYDEPTLRRLLDLQAEDTAIQRLEQRRGALPEKARLGEIEAQLSELAADLEIAAKQHSEVVREHSRLEGEVDLLETRIGREEGRLFSGGVSNPKELGNLQSEVESLKRKKSSLEDELLEVMEQRESAAETQTRLQSEHEELGAEAARLREAVTLLESDIDAELSEHSTKRSQIAPDIPEDLITLYDKLRAQKGGVGAAPLEGGTCQGCHTKVPQKELEKMRAEGGLQRCENCRRILVVT